MKRKALVLSLEALLTLLASLVLLYFALPAPSPSALGHERVYENALVQDFLETGTKSEATLEKIVAFGKGDAGAKNFLETKYSRLLNQTGADCLLLEINGRGARTCKNGEWSGEANAASGTRLVFDGTQFLELKATLFFSAKTRRE